MVGRFVGPSARVSSSPENKHVMKKEVLWIICLGGMVMGFTAWGRSENTGRLALT